MTVVTPSGMSVTEESTLPAPSASGAATTPGDFVVTFGKYKGSTLGWIAERDVAYLKTLATSSKTVNTPERAFSDVRLRQLEASEEAL